MKKNIPNQFLWTKMLLMAMLLLLTDSFSMMAQTKTITGKVSSDKGETLSGVTILIKGTKKGTSTDKEGKYSLEVANGNTLIFSFISYQSKEVVVSNESFLNVILSESTESLEEVVVTGVFDKRTALESSIAISTLNSKSISKIASNSAADLLSYTPGVYVNSAVGEINNTVFSRGVNANQFGVAGGNGFYYVSLMEDGLPVTNISSGNTVADYFYRADATLARLESVRGGSASITGANAPGGIFNYVSKTGQKAVNEISYKFGLEGNGRNPYNRVDGNLGGKLGDNGWFYNIGGFYRYSQGSRSPGYAQNRGGQIKANLVKVLSNNGSSLKIFAKYLDDRNGLPQYLPAQNYDKPQLVAGFGEADSYMLPSSNSVQPLWGTTDKFTFDPADLVHSRDLSLGSELNLNLKNGWTITNNLKYTNKAVEQSMTIMSSPTPLTNILTYALMGMVGPGTFSFKDRATGVELASVNADFSRGPSYTVTKNNLPANSVMQNGVLFNFTNYSKSKLNEFMEQLTINKKVGKHSISFGGFLASSHIETIPNGTANTALRAIQNRPSPLDITWTLPNGPTLQVTSPEGYAQLSGGRFSFKNYVVTQNQYSGFLADGIQVSSKLNLDLGLRFDLIDVNGSNNIGKENPNASAGGIDNNPLTLYDNYYFVKGVDIPYKTTLNTFSYSGGLNYKINMSNSVYIRYSSGQKAPDMQYYFDNYNSNVASPETKAQKVAQFELGYKFKGRKASGSIIPFYSNLSNIPVSTIAQDENGLAYYTPVVFNAIETFGLEAESNFNLTKNFSINANLTIQSAKATTWESWLVGANGKADDILTNNNGNKAENIPNLMFNVTPMYSFEKAYLQLTWKYMGARQSNMSNAFELPSFHQLNFGAGYNLSKKVALSANINNVANTFGIMNWSATTEKALVDAFGHNSFTPQRRAESSNSIYSVLAVQPRSFFLTATYNF